MVYLVFHPLRLALLVLVRVFRQFRLSVLVPAYQYVIEFLHLDV